MLKKLLSLLAGVLLTLTVYAATNVELRDDHPDTYVVKRGDTLWDIAARFLKKPWLWPEVWQANPQVHNPHLIYPGDVISLAYLNGRATLTSNGQGPGGPRVRATALEDAVQPIPLAELKNYLKNTRIIDEEALKNAPHVVGIEENQLRGAHGNLIYVRGLDAKPGQQFALVRPHSLYYSRPADAEGAPPDIFVKEADSIVGGEAAVLWHHFPNSIDFFHGRAELIGYEVLVFGQGTVTKQGNVSSLLVTYSDYEVRKGDLLLPVDDRPYDSQYFPHAPSQIPPNFRVVNFTDALNAVGSKQVVALSRGSKDGIENGQTYTVYHPGETVNDDYKYPPGSTRHFIHPRDSKVELPEEFVGHVMIFRTFDRVSYGLVMDSLRPVHLGDNLRAPE